MLIDRIKEDLKESIKSREEASLSALRLLLSEIHNREIEKKDSLTDEEVIGILSKQVRQSRESIEMFLLGRRNDLVTKEEERIEILNKYLPKPLTEDEVSTIITAVISEINATSPADMGKVMNNVMQQVKGKFDGSKVSALVKKELEK